MSLILSIFLLFQFSEANAAGNLRKMKVGHSSLSANRAPLWIAKDMGFFEKYGLDVDIVKVASGSLLITTVLSGDVQIIEAYSQGMVNAILRGGDAVIVGSLGNYIPFKLMAQTYIKTPEDLKGKKIAITRPGSMTDMIVRKLLEKWNLNPDKDVTLIAVGSFATTGTAFQSKSVDAYAGTEDDALGRFPDLQYRVLGSAVGVGFNQVANLFGASKKFTNEQPEAVVGFLSAYTEALHLAKTQPEKTKDLLKRYLNMTDNRFLQVAYDNYITPTTHLLPYPERSHIENILKGLYKRQPDLKKMSYEEIVDPRFADKVRASGLLKKLYGQ